MHHEIDAVPAVDVVNNRPKVVVPLMGVAYEGYAHGVTSCARLLYSGDVVLVDICRTGYTGVVRVYVKYGVARRQQQHCH